MTNINIMITILEKSQDKLVFSVNNSGGLHQHISTALCNSLRRIMISDIPTWAIDIVAILKNNSILIDDILAHRLGLIPIKVLDESFDLSTVTIKLNVKYDKDNTDIYGIHDVYSSSLEYDRAKIEINPDILIIRLLPDHEIVLDALLAKDTGYTHAKWSPVCATSFKEHEKDYDDYGIEDFKSGFTFKIETNGQMDPSEIFLSALDILENKLKCLHFK